MNSKLPVYKLVINDDDKDLGVHSVALVKFPAIETNFIAFSETDIKPKSLQLSIVDEDDQICIGPLLIPDQLIYRKNEDFEYYATVDKDTILQASIRFAENKNGNKVDIEHDGQLVKGVTMIGNYVSNQKYGLSNPAAFSNLPLGTWFIQYHVTDPEIWAEIKAQTFSGFSITGLFEEIPNDVVELVREFELALLEFDEKVPKPAYGDVEYADPGLQADGKKRYPIDTAEHVRSAWNYISHPKNAGLYSAKDLLTIKDRIIAAWKKLIDPKGPPSA